MKENRYTSKQVADAIGVELRDFMSWQERGIFKLDATAGDIEAGGKGRPRQITLQTALKAGVMAGLIRLGLKPKDANAAASEWSETGHGPLPGSPARLPMQIYGNGSLTFLCVFPDGSVDVKKVDRSTPATNLLLHRLGGNLQPGAITLVLDCVEKQVRTSLGVGDPIGGRENLASSDDQEPLEGEGV